MIVLAEEKLLEASSLVDAAGTLEGQEDGGHVEVQGKDQLFCEGLGE